MLPVCFEVPEKKKCRVIIDSDTACEADDPFAIAYALLSPKLKYIRPNREILREIFWVGVPATMETSLTSAAYIVNNNLAVAYGELTVAAMGIAQNNIINAPSVSRIT